MSERSTDVTKPSILRSKTVVSDALAFSLEKIRHTLATVTSFPEYTDGDHWICGEDGGWTGAHWVGQLWLATLHSSDPVFEAAARAWTARLMPRQYDTTTHDLGFLFELSYILGGVLTGDVALKAPALQAATTLAKRYNHRGNYLQAWGALDGTFEQRGRSIIDSMMNLDLFFWATQETGNPIYAEMASGHARTALLRHVREDGSSAHVTDFNPDTGEFLKQDTHQGFSAESAWARGQAWASYGFAECYRHTGDLAFLEASRKLASYFLRRLPDDHVPYWDFDSPLIPNDVRDSSAAAIVASALLILARYEPDRTQADYWRTQAIMLIEALWTNYSSRNSVEPSILIHGTRHKPYGTMDHGLIYGDYYFVEALTRLLMPDLNL